jgi:hypothetical protein
VVVVKAGRALEYAAEGWVAQIGGWSSKNMVIPSGPSTQEGGACRIPQRVLCGGRVPPGPAATFHGILRRGEAGRQSCAYGRRLVNLSVFFP